MISNKTTPVKAVGRVTASPSTNLKTTSATKTSTITTPSPQKTIASRSQMRAKTPGSGKKVSEPIAEEEKKEAPKTGLFTEKPSARLSSIKTADPFAPKSKMKTNSFEYIYNAGGIPCRIDHGSVNNRLKWDNNIVLSEMNFDPLLVTCFEGLVEEAHPYCFIAKEASKEMLESSGAAEKTIPLLPKLANPLRQALANPNKKVFESTLSILKLLSDTVGDALNEHLNTMLGQLVKRMNDRTLNTKVTDVLRVIETNGGPSVTKLIKAKVPTYCNM